MAPEVIEAMAALWSSATANASSLHRSGVRAARAVETARSQVAQRLGAKPEQIVFTSGGTEANNLAIKGTIAATGRSGGHLICTAIEHPSVLAPMRWLQARGFDLTILPVDRQGQVQPDSLRQALRPDTLLVSIIHGSNELGTVQDLAVLGEICRRAGAPLHTDACQSFTKLPVELATLPVDLVSINAHKIHGPQGVGALWLAPGITLEATAHGGGQERGLRSGTSNTAGIAGFGVAAASFGPARRAALQARHAQLLAGLDRRFPTAHINGPRGNGLPHIVSVTFPGSDAKRLFQQLNRAGFEVSTGSACHATATTPSPALLAVGLEPADALATLRISHGYTTTPEQIDALLDTLHALLRATPGTT